MNGVGQRSNGSNGQIQHVLVRSLMQRWQRYQKEWHRCRERASEESVHDFRVASRRLISTVGLTLTVMPDAPMARCERELKRRLKTLGPLRDLQVQLLKVDTMRSTYPELSLFRTVLLLREQRALAQIRRMLRSSQNAEISRNLVACRKRLLMTFADSSMQAMVLAALTGVATGTFSRAVSCLRSVNRRDLSTVHRLRVTFKKFRYTVEALQPVIPFATGAMLKSMNAYQKRMGDLQDNVVMVQSLIAYSGKRKRLCSRPKAALLLERKQLLEAFLDSSAELYTFWPEVPSPTKSASLV